jgi:cytokinin riboside 5'-monophosphate phosphoribohydrolase
MAAAGALGERLAAANVGLVFGGSGSGVMGTIASATLHAGGSVIGVLPEVLLAGKEIAHPELRQLAPGEAIPDHPRVWISTADMATRKEIMARHADAFLALPGGYGTLDEIFEMLTWTQINVHQKRVCLWNLDGFYDHLLAFLDHAVGLGLLLPHNRALLTSVDTLDEVIAWIGAQPAAAS